MSIFFLVSNGTHVVAIDQDDLESTFDADEAVEAAKARFTKAGMDSTTLSVLKEVNTDHPAFDTEGGPQTYGLSDGAFRAVAHDMLDDDDRGIDDDAEVADAWVSSWTYLSPADVLGHLSDSETAPMPIEREVPDRHEAAWLPYAALSGECLLLLASLPDILATSTADADEIKRVKESLDRISGMTYPLPTRSARQVHQQIIRTWEHGEGSADGFTADQLKAWRVSVESQGNQLSIALRPAGQSMEEAEIGLGLLVEVNRGFPAVHISPGPMADNCIHVHAISDSQVEVTAANGYPSFELSQVYDRMPPQAAIYDNGSTK